MPKTSKQIAYLEYTFIFDPSKMWSTMQDFEYDFAKFLAQYGIQAEFVDNIMGDKKRIFHLYKAPENTLPNPSLVKKPTNARNS